MKITFAQFQPFANVLSGVSEEGEQDYHLQFYRQ